MNELISENFLACTSFLPEVLHDIVSLDGYRKYKEKFKKEDFREKLIPHDMVEYTEPLFDFMLIECKKHDENKVNLGKNNITTREDLKFKEEIVLALIGLFSGGKLQTEIVNIPKKDPIAIKNTKLINLVAGAVIQSLRDEINRLGLNVYPLSNVKAKEAINNKSDVDWIREWMFSTGYLDPEYQSFTLDNFDAYFEKLNMSDRFGVKKYLLDNLIEEFAYAHPTEAPLDIQELDRILLKIRKEKSKPGPKEKIANLKYLAFTLSSLKRLDRYLDDPQIKTMHDLSITNVDLRFVHDVMAFFNLIGDYSRSKKTMQGLEPAIRKMIADLNDPVTISDTYLSLQILKFHYLNNKNSN